MTENNSGLPRSGPDGGDITKRVRQMLFTALTALAKRTHSTGLNGLQQRCDQIILLSLPWTDAACEQINGRARWTHSKNDPDE